MSRKTHGLKYHSLYATWDSMMQRCNNPKHNSYKNYGARGIKVSEEFKNCKIYIEYIESLPNYFQFTKLQVDRIDNNQDYKRDNLRLATQDQQHHNKRNRSDNKSGYKGVAKAVNSSKWRAYIYQSKKQVMLGSFNTIKEAVEARNQYIIDNKLFHKIQTYV